MKDAEPEPTRATVHFDDYSENYRHALQRGLAVSGEDRDFFAQGRIDHVRRTLVRKPVRRVLDYGCGDGESCQLLAAAFPGAEVVGTDVSLRSVDLARRRLSPGNVRFLAAEELRELDRWTADLVYTNGVFHHIAPRERDAALAQIMSVLGPEGVLAFWENNPWNVGTRLVMSRIPFDRDAIPLSPRVTHHLLRANGLRIDRIDYLFYFPRPLAFLRWTEPLLRRLPLGAQYCAFCMRAPRPFGARHAHDSSAQTRRSQEILRIELRLEPAADALR